MNSSTVSISCRQFVFSAVLGEFNSLNFHQSNSNSKSFSAFFLLAVMAQALPLASQPAEFEFPSALLVIRPWAESSQPAEWRGQWIRRLSPRIVSHLGQFGLGNSPTIAVQKKWTRLEPSIRFYWTSKTKSFISFTNSFWLFFMWKIISTMGQTGGEKNAQSCK